VRGTSLAVATLFYLDHAYAIRESFNPLLLILYLDF
jgi:hypothetical protein